MSFSKLSRIQELDINKEPKKMLDQLAKLGRLYECIAMEKITFHLVKDYPNKKEFFEAKISVAKMWVDDYARGLGKVVNILGRQPSAISGNQIHSTIQLTANCLDFVSRNRVWTNPGNIVQKQKLVNCTHFCFWILFPGFLIKCC